MPEKEPRWRLYNSSFPYSVNHDADRGETCKSFVNVDQLKCNDEVYAISMQQDLSRYRFRTQNLDQRFFNTSRQVYNEL